MAQQLLIFSAHLVNQKPQANPFPHVYMLSPRRSFLVYTKPHLLNCKGGGGERSA